jgi:hypothetical protein
MEQMRAPFTRRDAAVPGGSGRTLVALADFSSVDAK